MSSPTPDHIMKIASGFGVSRCLLTAVGLGLFTRLNQGPMTRQEIMNEFGLHDRPAGDFLDLLVSVNLLARQGNDESALYENTQATGQFLDKTKPEYIGGILELWDKRNYRYWNTLEDGLKTGKPQNENRHSEKPFFETLYSDPDRLEAFMEAMNGSSLHNFQLLAQKFPFDQYKTLTDIGGADALLSRTVSAKHPHLTCTSFDLPVVKDIAARKIEKAGLSDRITPVAGDFFNEALPAADVITMGMILHDWNLHDKKLLIQKAYDALPEGGALIAIESFIDDARRENTFGLYMSLTMLIEFGDAFDFTAAEFITWCRDAGFTKFEIFPLAGPSSAAVAYK